MKIKMRILISAIIMTCAALMCSAETASTIKKVWILPEVDNDSIQCMAIHVDFDLAGVKGKDIECQAIFYSSPGGWALRDANDNYRLSPSLNYVAAQSMFKAKKDEYNVPDQSILIPIDELHLKPGRKYRIYAKVSLYCNPGRNGQFLGESEYVPIIVDLKNPDQPHVMQDLGKIPTPTRTVKGTVASRKGGSSQEMAMSTSDAVTPTEDDNTFTSHNSKVKKKPIDKATFWVKEEVDSASLPKLYIE
ncbi:hypothetical protein [uncultured Muribaculum sp.]|uniref:hypothetical protein n=1 Tax=uncultured Muribaculum sp. TaxID=1918613 RepID=UPI0025AFB980|nr:hypothetical protein [uncultured Muribaculum sp.]